MADGHEEAADRDLALHAVLLDGDAAELAVAFQFRDDGIQDKLDVLFPAQPVNKGFLTAERIPPVYQIHPAAEITEQHGVLQGAVPAAVYGDSLPFEEGPVADGAVADTGADQLVFSLQAQLPRFGAGGENHRTRVIFRAEAAVNPFVGAEILDPEHLVDLDLGTHVHGLFGHAVSQIHPADGRNGGIVFHLRRPGDLSAQRILFQDEDAFPRAAGIHRRRQAGRAAADDDDVNHDQAILLT